MAFVSVTRLRPRSLRFLPAVAFHTWRSRSQVKRAEGFLGGYLASGPKLALWTVTVWADEAAMMAYRNGSPHLKAMPKLIGSCDEASVVHWKAENASVPSPDEAAERMRQGRTSKVRYPSRAQRAGNPWPDGKVPVKGPGLQPQGSASRRSSMSLDRDQT